MNMLAVIGAVGAFLYGFRVRIICIIRPRYVQFRRHFRGGCAYWQGRVLGGGVRQQGGAGVDVEKGGGAERGAVREPAPGVGLVVGMPGHSERSGAAGRGAVTGFQKREKVLHGGRPVHRARRRVIVSPAWRRFDIPTAIRQRVVDGAENGQSVFFMPL